MNSLRRAVVTGLSLTLPFFWLACDPGIEGSVSNDTQAVNGLHRHGQPVRPMNALQNTSAPAGAHLTYYGGRVVSNMQVVEVLYGTGNYLPQVSSTASPSMATFYQGVLNSGYVDWLTEYNTTTQSGTRTNQTIGRGSFSQLITITPSAANSGSTVDDSNIQAELSAQIQAGHLPAPTHDAAGNNNTYYAIFFPHGVTITQGGSSSCVAGGFCAYHGTVANVPGFGEVYYGVHPDMQAGSGCDTGCGGAATAFANYTSVASHEMTETITDCEVGLATTTAAPLAWYDNTNGEIGDICNAQQGTIVGSDGVTYTVQKEFSNTANDCIVSRTVSNDFSISASPTSLSVADGSSGAVTISTAVASGSAESISLSASGLPSGVTASFSPSSVTSGGSSTLTFTASSTAAAGTHTITVTGTAASGSHTTSVSLTITSTTTTNNFSLSLSPTSASVTAGSASTVTVSTAVTSGSAQSVSLSASGLPSGVTASFNPSSVTAGGTSTLTLTASSSAPAASATVTVTGTGASATHSASLALTVTSGSTGGGGIANGGFESGLTSWTTAGTASIATSGCHGGTQCAMLGGTSPTNGDSTAAQTFTVPSGAGQLSLWYKNTCPDSVSYDWATVTLKDNTAGTSATLLPNICTNNAWTQVTGNVTAGHSYTLTLVNHDDNYPGDPTYTLYDDVTLNAAAPPPPPPSSGITNGGFESGLTGWTGSGASVTVVSGGHSGSSSLRLGNTTPTNGSSNAAQSFTVPSGASKLSLWYKMTCPDTVTYDWATVTLKNLSTNAVTTVLAKTCATDSSWVNVTAAVTAGQSYTVTLTSHDDNYGADPSYTLYDDVALQ